MANIIMPLIKASIIMIVTGGALVWLADIIFGDGEGGGKHGT